MSETQQPDPCLLVIFGASGDLTRRKLIPALYELHVSGHLPRPFRVLGVSRSELGDDGFREQVLEGCRKCERFSERGWSEFSSLLHYQAGDATDPRGFEPIRARILSLAQQMGIGGPEEGANVLFYLSLAPHLYELVIDNIGASGLVYEGRRWCALNPERVPWQRIIVEKPFGHDLVSAARLNRTLGRVFEEEATFRIDHYLGKETVQNLAVVRFANAIFEPLWNRHYVDHVQITAAETVGVEGRGSYYDQSGALRDMIQSHLLQLMAAVAMEPPAHFRADDLRMEQRKVLEATPGPEAERVPRVAVRGQYAPGQLEGRPVPGYRQEPGVPVDSDTETYAALHLGIENWRWQGVPFVLRTGKRMHRKLSQIAVQFRQPPHVLFTRQVSGSEPAPNRLLINVQPDEGISLRFEGKVPGQGMELRSAVMDFDYVEQFGGQIPEAYAHLLLDAMRGDRSLFKSRHEIEAAWRIVMPVLDRWAAHPGEGMHEYEPGSWGPAAADELLADRGGWHNPEGASSRWRREPVHDG